MSKIDSRLKFLAEQAKSKLPELETLSRFSVEAKKVETPRVRVLLRYNGDLAKIKRRGLEIHTVAGDVVSGVIELDKLAKIESLDDVITIESSRPMTPELDISIPDIRADVVHSSPPGYKGSGVIVGIIDTGIDFTHECFRKADGTSRILAIWDQWLTATGSESNPPGYAYGVEYTKTDIDTALTAADPFSVVRHGDPAEHGSHVAGIAAGDGSVAGDSQPAFTYVGVAPEADIIVVANAPQTEALGDSANTLDAVQYIFTKAASLGKPAVINLSQGDNLGPHDGTSLLERGIDNLLGEEKGRSMVKSAGNAANDDIHASGTVPAGGALSVEFVVPSGDTSPDTIDIWYPGGDQFGITLTTPGAAPTAAVSPGTTTTLTLPNGNQAFVDSVLNDPNNNDNRIYIQLSRGSAAAIERGTWALTLHGTAVSSGRFDAWIERGRIIPRFIGPHSNNSRTISTPGTSDKIIAVACYITRGAGPGNISSFSSIGPTRDGRQKPEIAAPGERIMSVKSGASGTDQYRLMSGTSMSAPHVTGTIALMLQNQKTLTQAQIKKCIIDNARTDAFTGATPNNTWGYGKLDAKAAFDCAAPTPVCTYSTEPTPGCKYWREPSCKFWRETSCKFWAEPGCQFWREPGCQFWAEPGCQFWPEPGCKFRPEPGPAPERAPDARCAPQSEAKPGREYWHGCRCWPEPLCIYGTEPICKYSPDFGCVYKPEPMPICKYWTEPIPAARGQTPIGISACKHAEVPPLCSHATEVPHPCAYVNQVGRRICRYATEFPQPYHPCAYEYQVGRRICRYVTEFPQPHHPCAYVSESGGRICRYATEVPQHPCTYWSEIGHICHSTEVGVPNVPLCTYVTEPGVGPCAYMTQVMPGCNYMQQLGPCPPSMTVSPGGCGSVSLIVPTAMQPALRNKVLIAVDKEVLASLKPGTFVVVQSEPIPAGAQTKEPQREPEQHFTQLTSTAERPRTPGYGPVWENLFDKGNEAGY